MEVLSRGRRAEPRAARTGPPDLWMARTMPRENRSRAVEDSIEEETMRLDECMTRGVECTHPEATLQEAALMAIFFKQFLEQR